MVSENMNPQDLQMTKRLMELVKMLETVIFYI